MECRRTQKALLITKFRMDSRTSNAKVKEVRQPWVSASDFRDKVVILISRNRFMLELKI
jgi:hypothetical protein